MTSTELAEQHEEKAYELLDTHPAAAAVFASLAISCRLAALTEQLTTV